MCKWACSRRLCAPTALMVMRQCQPLPRLRHQRSTMPSCENVKVRKRADGEERHQSRHAALEHQDQHRRDGGDQDNAVAERQTHSPSREGARHVAVIAEHCEQPRKIREAGVGGEHQHQQRQTLQDDVQGALADERARDLAEHGLDFVRVRHHPEARADEGDCFGGLGQEPRGARGRHVGRQPAGRRSIDAECHDPERAQDVQVHGCGEQCPPRGYRAGWQASEIPARPD